MSQEAPWFALASDWWLSAMFDGLPEEARLAWVYLLTYAKQDGRRGEVTLDHRRLCRVFGSQISATTWDGLLQAAERHRAIERRPDGRLRLVNWDRYQNSDSARSKRKRASVSKVSSDTNATHPSPSTHHQAPITKDQADNPPSWGGCQGETSSVTAGDIYDLQDRFARLLSAIPARLRRGPARIRREFTEAVVDRRADPERIIARIVEYYLSPHGKSAMHWEPVAWLRDGHYEDPPEAWAEGERSSIVHDRPIVE